MDVGLTILPFLLTINLEVVNILIWNIFFAMINLF